MGPSFFLSMRNTCYLRYLGFLGSCCTCRRRLAVLRPRTRFITLVVAIRPLVDIFIRLLVGIATKPLVVVVITLLAVKLLALAITLLALAIILPVPVITPLVPVIRLLVPVIRLPAPVIRLPVLSIRLLAQPTALLVLPCLVLVAAAMIMAVVALLRYTNRHRLQLLSPPPPDQDTVVGCPILYTLGNRWECHRPTSTMETDLRHLKSRRQKTPLSSRFPIPSICKLFPPTSSGLGELKG